MNIAIALKQLCFLFQKDSMLMEKDKCMRLSRNLQMNKLDLLFFPAWILYVTSVMLESTAIALDNNTIIMAYKLLRYISYALCFMKICHEIYITKHIPLLVIFVFVFVLSFYKSQNKTMIFYSLIMLASYRINGEKIIKTAITIQGMILLFIIVLSQLGIVLDYVFIEEGRNRHSLGFIWTTVAPITFFYFVMGYVYIHRRRIKWFMNIILGGIATWLFFKTNTKMVFILTITFLVFILFENLNKKRFRLLSKFKAVFIAYPFLMWLFMFVACKLFNPNNQTWMSINTLLSGRLRLSQDAISLYGINLLGNNVEWKGLDIFNTSYAIGEYNYVDSSYLQLTITHGMIYMLVVLIIFSYAIYKHIKANDYYAVTIYIFILTLSLTEPQLMKFGYNPFSLLAFGMVAKSIFENRLFRQIWEKGNSIFKGI